MMSLPFAYIPATGFNDTTQFPDNDPNIRAHMQALLDQIKDCLNNDVNIQLSQKAAKVQPVWITPALVNGWVNFGGGYATVAYFKDEMGFVHIKGFIKSGVTTAGTLIFTLPAGYRPAENHYVATVTNNGGSNIFADLVVYSGGGITIGTTAGSTFLSLNIPPFKAEA